MITIILLILLLPLGQPTCSTCIVTHTNSAGVPISNYTCDDGCRTTDYYAGSVNFPSANSSCNGIVSASSNGTFCTFFVVSAYYSTNNNVYYYGFTYNNYVYGPITGVIYYATGYLPHCANNNNYYCCCA